MVGDNCTVYAAFEAALAPCHCGGRKRFLADLRSRLESGELASVTLPACPLMHGTGQFSSFITMILGGCVVTLPDPKFDPAVLWDAVERHGVNTIAIVGDAFARPMLAALDAEPARRDPGSR